MIEDKKIEYNESQLLLVNKLDQLNYTLEESKLNYNYLHEDMRNFSKIQHQKKNQPIKKGFFSKFFQLQEETKPTPQHKLLDFSYNEYKEIILKKYSIFKDIKGIYAYGSPGCGKTFLMDMFYDICPLKKLKTHFNFFMLDVHQRLHKIKNNVINYT